MLNTSNVNKRFCLVILLIIALGLRIFLPRLMPYCKLYWLMKMERDNKVLMSPTEINDFNEQVRNNPNKHVLDLLEVPESFDKKFFASYVQYMELNPTFNLDLSGLKKETVNIIGYGIAINRANLRVVPTDHILGEDRDNMDIDLWQQKEVKFGEAFIVLYNVNEWYFVQTVNAWGWLKKKDIAFCDRDQFEKYLNTSNFVVVLDKLLKLDQDYLDMGARLILVEEDDKYFKIKLPSADINGNLTFNIKHLEKTGLHKGYLPYTRYNLIKQAMKYLGTSYGWGGLNNGVDCSGFILNIFSVFGFVFPRQSGDQQKIGNIYFDFDISLSDDALDKMLRYLPSGTILYMKGHIMLYLGVYKDKPYIIHSSGSYYTKDGRRKKSRKVIITDLDLLKKNGLSFKKALMSATIIE